MATIVASSKRHTSLSLLLILVGGDKTNCVCMRRSKNCTECRIKEAVSCENVKGHIDNWDLSNWNTKKHPPYKTALKWIKIWKREVGKRKGNLWKMLAVLILQTQAECNCCRGVDRTADTHGAARILRIGPSVICSVLICIKVIKLIDTEEELTQLLLKNCYQHRTIKVYYYVTHLSAAISFLQDT